MLIFWKKKLVLFSVPKTGTSAIETALAPFADIAIIAPPVLKHMPVYRFNRFMTPLFDAVNAEGLERFALIREPIDWLGSWYRYRSRPELDGQDNSTKDISFDDFVLGAMKGKPPSYAHVGSQAKFLSGGVGPDGAQHLYQYEQMQMAIDFLEQRLDQKIDLKQENVSPPRTFSASPSVIERYTRKRAEEYVLWEAARK